MGANFSMKAFELINNVLIIVGCGPLGILVFINNELTGTKSFLKTLLIASLTAVSLFYVCTSWKKASELASAEKVILITGCDSGLGFSLAHHACEIGFTVVAGCLNLNSEGAKELDRIFGEEIKLLELDITNNDSIENCLRTVEKYLQENEHCVFWALINNAGVMVFGEFEWLTERLIQHQLSVNLSGTMYITKVFLPLLRKHLGRVITVTSHCANATLPGLAVYGATKAGLAAWCDGLRVEQEKYGVPVVTLIPGSFVLQSNIMSKQNENVFEMQSSMTSEQLSFYGDYFRLYNSYLSVLSGDRKPSKISDFNLYEIFERTLLDIQPFSKYVHESWRYKFYHTLFKISPIRLRDYFVVKFVQMPEWNRERKIQNISDVIA